MERSHSNIDDLIDDMIPEPEQRSLSSSSSSSSSASAFSSGFSSSGSGSFQLNNTVPAAGYDQNDNDNDDDNDDDDIDDDDGDNGGFAYWNNNKAFCVFECLERFRNIRRNPATLTTPIAAGTDNYPCPNPNPIPNPNRLIACCLPILMCNPNLPGLNDCCSYRGQFSNNLPHGSGIIELRNGRIWEGECKEGIAQVPT